MHICIIIERKIAMPDKKGNLYLYEALELRAGYDRHIDLLESLIGVSSKKSGFFREDDEYKEPSADFNQKEIQEILKNLQTKRVKLNQELQKANFETKIEYKGEKISVAEALETRKNLLEDIKATAERVKNSSFKRVIHKEERDIVQEPQHRFREIYTEYKDNIQQLRQLVKRIHFANYLATVKFKDE
jgi:hypothetical protein